MNVIPYAGTILGGVVAAEDGQLLPLAVGYLEDDRDQVSLRIVGLADLAGGMGTAGVEVPQGHITQSVGFAGPGHHFLHRQLGFTVAIGGNSLVGLQDGHLLGLAVGGGGGGKYDLVYSVGHHSLEEYHRPVEVVVVVLQGIGHGLSHLGGGGEVDHTVDLLRLEQHIQSGPVPDVQLVEPGFGMNSGLEAGLEVIGHNHIPASVDEFIHSVGADVPCSA